MSILQKKKKRANNNLKNHPSGVRCPVKTWATGCLWYWVEIRGPRPRPSGTTKWAKQLLCTFSTTEITEESSFGGYFVLIPSDLDNKATYLTHSLYVEVLPFAIKELFVLWSGENVNGLSVNLWNYFFVGFVVVVFFFACTLLKCSERKSATKAMSFCVILLSSGGTCSSHILSIATERKNKFSVKTKNNNKIKNDWKCHSSVLLSQSEEKKKIGCQKTHNSDHLYHNFTSSGWILDAKKVKNLHTHIQPTEKGFKVLHALVDHPACKK